ncbi:TetR/AcrR family transcriptional regulator [Dictyobacter aurantiacus]|uniref:HTH tetR-type domain-containing protein n=1 Tax=Dictyobacter aurantiacus TaxID=1936993 RepID=A0A401ZP52_9CHLR|nr:TetR/AcrR family transcriptional regulator [Dictyobacter aurantiacus]GCE08622.1 hypothetical protein KDAU_59510 [Dictyobacter aurantiacus]
MIFDRRSANGDKRHTERDPETQRRILAVAERLFLAKGFKGVSMKDIADEVQVTAAALYYYFPGGKQELFISMVQQWINNWTRQTFEAVSHVEGTRAKLTRVAEAFFSRQFSNFFALIRDVEEFCGDNPGKRELFRKNRQDRQYLQDIFQQGIDSGELRADVPAKTYISMFEGIMMGIQFKRHFNVDHEDESPVDVPFMAEMVVNCLLDGISKKSD